MLNNLKRKTANKKAKRVGRGGNKGRTAGRGQKGQKSRAGHRIRPNIRDEIKRLPKKRGHGVQGNRNKDLMKKSKFFPINLSVLESHFSNNEKVNPKILFNKNLIQKKAGKLPNVKILASGNLTKKLNILDCAFSKTAQDKIIKLGGKIK